MTESSFWKWAPLGAASTFFLFGIVVRVAIHFARTGSTGFALTTKDLRQRIGGFSLVAASVVVCWEAVVAAMEPERIAPLAIPAIAGHSELRIAGLVLALVATALMFAAQLNLGTSWRIGIEEAARPGLVTGGFYAISRNPIFTTLLVGLAAFVLVLPTWISVAAVLIAFGGIRVQIGAEEAWLRQAYGDAYSAYAKRVGRFVPWLGRL
jgi:protein-S-isoprenylcysteine O-methyltransferase Ste14